MRSRSLSVIAGVALLAFGVVAVIGGGLAEGHAGHPQKKLFPTRWHHQVEGQDYDSWMDLTTSAVWFNCGDSDADCESRWGVPAQDAIDDWNSQPTTVRFVLQPDQSALYDVNIFIDPLIFGDPTLLGIAYLYDENEDECFFGCDVWYADVVAADEAHTDPYDGPLQRQSTVAHEMGHAVSLAHESVDFDCEEDVTGEVPPSLMAYDCIDPVPFGDGLFEVQAWDVCGVNHAYFDPTISFAMCDGLAPTPTPTLAAGQEYWGDGDCGGAFNIGDAINTARRLVSLSVNSQPGCPALGTVISVSGESRTWGDIDCGGAFNIGDAINISRKLVELPVNQSQGCPALKSVVTLP